VPAPSAKPASYARTTRNGQYKSNNAQDRALGALACVTPHSSANSAHEWATRPPLSDVKLLIARQGSQLAVQSSDTIGSPVVLILGSTRPTAKRGLTVRFYVEPVQFLNLGSYFRTCFAGSHPEPPVKLGDSQDARRFWERGRKVVSTSLLTVLSRRHDRQSKQSNPRLLGKRRRASRDLPSTLGRQRKCESQRSVMIFPTVKSVLESYRFLTRRHIRVLFSVFKIEQSSLLGNANILRYRHVRSEWKRRELRGSP
jgi:hypothetical protein